MSRNLLKASIILFIGIDLSLAAIFINNRRGLTITDETFAAELLEAAKHTQSFDEFKNYLQNVAQTKGAVYAYKVLKVAKVPVGADMHLLGHVVGDELYKQQGAAGIAVCTEDFRNACSHTIVVGLLLDKGEQALSEIAAACKKAPGGAGAYTMCYHGLGHGVLAYSDFDVKKAVDLCGKVQPQGFSGPEAVQCVGGIIMEIISGGDHDKASWGRERAIYLQKTNPLSPCSSDFMPEEAKPMCYIYLTPHLFQVAGADLGNPQPEHFEKAFTYCSKISENDMRNFDACYGGFGKEFVVLAAGRDIRMSALSSTSGEQFKKVHEWCRLADRQKGIEACITNAVNSYYWGGENEPIIAIAFCNSVAPKSLQELCFQHFTSVVAYYRSDQNYRREVCNQMPEDHRGNCQKKLLN